jgi:hypothetical protein
MTARLLCAAIVIAACTFCPAQAQTAGLSELSSTSDSDGFDALRLRAAALFDYKSQFDYAGVAAQTTHYGRHDWNRDAPAVLVLWRKQDRDTLAGTIAEAGVVRVAGHTRLIGDATWSLRPSPRTGIEFLAASDVVETEPALERGIAHAFYAISGERELTPRLTLIALAGDQRFTDGNERRHLRGRLIWMLVPTHGISAQVRFRRYRSNQTDAGGAYFNPDRYQQWDVALAMRKRTGRWIVSATLAAGQETIDDALIQSTFFAGVRAEGRLGARAHVVLYASYNRSAGFTETEDAWFRVAGISLVVPF